MMVTAVLQMVCLVLVAYCHGCRLQVAPPSARSGPHQLAAVELQELSQQVALQALADGQGRP